ncbi:MAG TPA: Uma2 family endonuclease [Bacteroidetes bacterium]|nr:Uma2 family endonuclease [Bacteroidota bacterium]
MKREPKKFFTEKEYLQFERNTELKHEFYKGEIFDMDRQPKKYFTEKEYLEFERNSDTKHEYYKGEIFDLAGVSLKHNQIMLNLAFLLRSKLKGKCRLITNDVKVKIQTNSLITYPDLAIICGKIELSDDKQDTILNPKVIFEILSPSNQEYDKNQKFALYKEIPSLEEYILIYQDEVKAECFLKKDNWEKSGYAGEGVDMKIKSLGIDLSLKEIYEGIEN